MIRDLINKLNGVSDKIKKVHEIVNQVVSDNSDVLLSLNRDQMLLGRNSDGDELGPNYLQDPYFKSREAAERYARMKYALEPSHVGLIWNPQLFPDKSKDTPNLIVTGSFQDAMFISVSGGKYNIGSTYVDASDISQKYNNKVFGLAPQSKEYFYRQWILPELLKVLNL